MVDMAYANLPPPPKSFQGYQQQIVCVEEYDCGLTDVAIKIRRILFMYSCSVALRSSIVIPAWCTPMPTEASSESESDPCLYVQQSFELNSK